MTIYEKLDKLLTNSEGMLVDYVVFTIETTASTVGTSYCLTIDITNFSTLIIYSKSANYSRWFLH